MKIIRKAIYPSPCSLLFLPFLLSFFVFGSVSPSLSRLLFFPQSSLITLYIHWMGIAFSPLPPRPWWTTCPVPDGNRGTFIRRGDRLDSNNLLILIILITSRISERDVCTFRYFRLPSAPSPRTSFAIYEFPSIFSTNFVQYNARRILLYRIIFPSPFIFNEEHYTFRFIS